MTTTLNIGIVAHVDAGKTSLTERLLYDAGAIDRLGSVETGNTRTDSGRIERERGITVRTAVAPFRVGSTQVNLIDTPGHTDFVAEVERALSVLDGAVLVLSAVEGVQAHTRVLMRTLRDAGLPAVLFVNKTDRRGARPEGVLADIRRRLVPDVVALNRVREAGTPDAETVARLPADPVFAARLAEVLAEHDEDLLARLVEERPLPPAAELDRALAAQVRSALVYPVMFGSAITGEGTGALARAVTEHFPVSTPEPDPGEPCGTVFAIDRSDSGEKTGYLRLRSGRLTRRAEVTFTRADGQGSTHRGRITGLEVVGAESDRARALVSGGIGRIRGLSELRVGDRLGPPSPRTGAAHFARPLLESVVRPEHEGDGPRLHKALTALADQDPLIGVRTVPGRGVLVLLYGEVQKQVIAATLADDFGLRVRFESSRVMHTERPAGIGEAVETVAAQPPDGFQATVGLRVEPAARGTGVAFRREVELGALFPSFDRAVEETVRRCLHQGVHGWPVTDCVVVLIRTGQTPDSTAGDFRSLTPMVLLRALNDAGTRVFEPVHTFELQVPDDTLGPVLARLAELEARVDDPVPVAVTWTLDGQIPARNVHAFQTDLPGLTRGEGFWLTRRSGERPVAGSPPRRPRTDGNPLVRSEYMLHLAQQGAGGRR